MVVRRPHLPESGDRRFLSIENYREVMNKKSVSGILGIVVGGAWLASNFKHFDEQGFVAIGMPLLILIAGVVYLFLGMKSS
jgi:hypothetical protein